MTRRFNTTGPCRPDWHYMIPAERRLPEVPGLIDQMGYFVVHAPRQTGKTTVLRALAASLTASGRYAALVFSCESGGVADDDYGAAERILLDDMRRRADDALPPELRPPPSPQVSPGSLVNATLAAWARACPRPLVLFLDEIDALLGQSLLSVLRQIRAGFADRPSAFPSSVLLCGVRDLRDYKAASRGARGAAGLSGGAPDISGDPNRLGTSSPFNIKLKSLRLGNFSQDEVRELYAQHTADTGQAFADDAVERVFEVTAGQPWLVNSLAHEIVDEMAVPPSEVISTTHIEQAQERLILARATHLDSLVDKLTDPRVRRVIEPLIAGTYEGAADTYNDDVHYVRDLGLAGPEKPLSIANPIYREIIVRVLAARAEEVIPTSPTRTFVLPDGRLDLLKILREFAEFWREHGETLAAGIPYHEVAPQLVLMAYLQRVVNGGGHIEREVGVGRGRIDLLVRWPCPGAQGARAWQREALELKVRRAGEKDPLPKGLTQLDGYLERLGLDTGVLVIFDRCPDAEAPEVRTRFEDAVTPSGRKVVLLLA